MGLENCAKADSWAINASKEGKTSQSLNHAGYAKKRETRFN